MDPGEEQDWVEIARVHDRFEAEITARFLDDHAVPVRTAGGANWALPMIGLTDMRILVPRTFADRAHQVLSAMRGGHAERHPFRDEPPEPYEAPRATRKAPLAMMLALLVPIGAGHFYARHTGAGAMLAGGILGGLVGAYFGVHALLLASVILIGIDAVLSPFAVRRYNRDATPSDATQRVGALFVVAAAYVFALLVWT
jgi:hypothetical protein